MDTLLQAAVVLAALFIGARYKGIGLGIWGGLGLLVLVLFFGVKPTSAPVDVMLILVAVVTAASVMYAAGGVDYMVRIAERIIRANPKRITLVAPFTTWFFTFLAGTAHMSYPLMPVIYEVAHSAGIRPERPMTVSMVGAQQAVTASPVSAATAALLGLLTAQHFDIGLGEILLIAAPASLVGVFVAACIQMHVGKELKDDQGYQARLKAGLIPPPTKQGERAALPKTAGLSALLFVLGVAYVVASGFFPILRTPAGGKPLAMATFLQIFMLADAAIILAITRTKLSDAMSSPIMRAGITALIAVFGLAWLGDSFISAHKAAWIANCSELISGYPWLFAVFLFFMSAVIASQAATVRAVMPLGLALGLTPGALIGMYPSVNGLFFVPSAGPLIATMSFDLSGTCRIGKFVFNHSFMLPGCVATIVAVATGLMLERIVL